jgi:hypothetical protein
MPIGRRDLRAIGGAPWTARPGVPFQRRKVSSTFPQRRARTIIAVVAASAIGDADESG